MQDVAERTTRFLGRKEQKMKYADYKIENLVFMKGTDGWSIEEKKEFLETCPENEGPSKSYSA